VSERYCAAVGGRTEVFVKDNLFWTVLFCVAGLCLALTVAHFAYAVYAYEHCSIIYFIGEELWAK